MEPFHVKRKWLRRKIKEVSTHQIIKKDCNGTVFSHPRWRNKCRMIATVPVNILKQIMWNIMVTISLYTISNSARDEWFPSLPPENQVITQNPPPEVIKNDRSLRDPNNLLPNSYRLTITDTAWPWKIWVRDYCWCLTECYSFLYFENLQGGATINQS